MNRVILSSIISLLLIAALAIGYFYYDGYTENKTYPESALPPEAAFFIKGNFQNLIHDLNAVSFWKNADSSSFIKELKGEINLLSDFFASGTITNNLTESSNAILSFQFTGVDKVGALFIFPVKKDLNINALADFVKVKNARISQNNTREFSGVSIYELNFQDEKKQFTYAFSSGIFIGSFTSYLVEDAIRQQSSGKIFGGDKAFASQYYAKSVNGDYTLCIHYPKFKNFISAFISQDNLYKLNDIDNWAEWSVQHVLISKEKIVADGFLNNRDKNFISDLFENCQPQPITVTEVLPSSTNAFQTMLFNDCNQWLDDYRNKIVENDIVKESKNNLQQFESKVKISISKQFTDIVVPEITVALAGVGTGNYENNVLALIKLKDPHKAEATLRELSFLSLDKKSKKVQFEEFNKHKIGLLPVDGLLPAVFGNSFSTLKKGFYTIHKNYLVVAGKVFALRAFIDEVSGNKLLKQNKSFENVLGYTKNQCNFVLYADVASSIPIWHEIANGKNLFITNVKHEYFKSFGSFLYIVSKSAQGKTDCRTIATFNTAAANRGAVVDWHFISDSVIFKGPFAFSNPGSGKSYILFQDSSANLNCLNETGTLLWQQRLDGLIQGKVNAINYFDSTSVQFLFSAGNKIYLLNTDGTTMGNYPIKLPVSPVNGIFHDKMADSYFVPCSNKRMYVYELTGRPAKGWEYVSTDAEISSAVYFTNIPNEDFIYFNDANGALYLFNTDGKRIFKNYMRQPAAGNHLSSFTDSSVSIIVADSVGTIYTYKQDNSVSIRSTDYTGSVLFYSNENLNEDNSLEHIIVHDQNITVLNNDFSMAFKFDSKNKLNGNAEIINAGIKKYILFSDNNSNIYLLNSKGKKISGFPIKGTTYSYYSKDNKIVLLVKEGSNAIKSYNIEE